MRTRLERTGVKIFLFFYDSCYYVAGWHKIPQLSAAIFKEKKEPASSRRGQAVENQSGVEKISAFKGHLVLYRKVMGVLRAPTSCKGRDAEW